MDALPVFYKRIRIKKQNLPNNSGPTLCTENKTALTLAPGPCPDGGRIGQHCIKKKAKG